MCVCVCVCMCVWVHFCVPFVNVCLYRNDVYAKNKYANVLDIVHIMCTFKVNEDCIDNKLFTCLNQVLYFHFPPAFILFEKLNIN